MLINLSEVTFENDFYEMELENGAGLTLNTVDEQFSYADEYDNPKVCMVNRINIVYTDSEGVGYKCPSVIGISNDYTSLDTDYVEYEGQVLNMENMQYCTITTIEEE